jgi:membrane associated rhomboid family serine protease
MDASAARPAARALLLPLAPAALALAVASVAVHVWVSRQGAIEDPALLVRLGALERGRIWDGEYWRLVTAAFLHGGWWHLMGNALGLALAGSLVERAVGAPRFGAIALLGAVGGSALSLLGHDAVAAGGSGAVFGLTGALLALHRRRVGSWRAFLRSGGTHLVAGVVLAAGAGTILLRDVMPPDDLAHAGGLVTGAAAGWLASGPPRRARWPSALFAAALSALVTAAVWPRARPTGFEALEMQREIHAALRRDDAGEAARLAAAARARGLATPALDYYEALVAAHEDRLEGALEALRALLDTDDERLRGEVRSAAARVARMLGYRRSTGDGRERDPLLGLAYLEESCALGEAQSCADAAAISGRAPVR